MKKFLLIFITAFIAGCSNLSSTLTPASISIASQEKIAASVSKSELYAVGTAKIDAAGSFIAEGKARANARENLKNKISSEVTNIFNSYMLNVDTNSKKIYTAVLSDLKTYTTDTLLLKASEKIALVDDNKSYVAVAVKKEDIAKESKFVFTEYTSSVIKKLENIKALVANSNIGLPVEEDSYTLPAVSDESDTFISDLKDRAKNSGFPTIEEDPLFQ